MRFAEHSHSFLRCFNISYPDKETRYIKKVWGFLDFAGTMFSFLAYVCRANTYAIDLFNCINELPQFVVEGKKDAHLKFMNEFITSFLGNVIAK